MDTVKLDSAGAQRAGDTANAAHDGKLGLIGGALGGLLASACCLGPLVLVSIGVSGAWISNLAALQPYRWVFVLAALGFMGYAWRQIYRPETACETGAACALPQTNRASRALFWIVAVLVLLAITFPYYVPLFY